MRHVWFDLIVFVSLFLTTIDGRVTSRSNKPWHNYLEFQNSSDLRASVYFISADKQKLSIVVAVCVCVFFFGQVSVQTTDMNLCVC